MYFSLEGKPALAVDIETCFDRDRIGDPYYVGNQLSIGRSRVRIIAVSEGTPEGTRVWDCWNPEQDAQARRFLEGAKARGVTLVGHNIVNFDAPILRRNGYAVGDGVWDTFIAEKVISEGRNMTFTLKDTIARRLPGSQGKGQTKHTIWNKPYADNDEWRNALDYARRDVIFLPAVAKKQERILAAGGLAPVWNMERELHPILMDASVRGMPVDMRKVALSIEETLQRGVEAKRFLSTVIDGDFNPSSANDIGAALRWAGVEPELTATGMVARGKDALGRLYARHAGDEQAEQVLRSIASVIAEKKINEKWMELSSHLDGGRVYGGFKSFGATTGRMSSSNMNFQSIPGAFRKAFTAPEGMRFVVADYSQIEVRICAWLTGDRKLIDACLSDDIYSAIGTDVYGRGIVKGEDIQERDLMKVVVLGSQYGGGVYTMLQNNYERAIASGDELVSRRQLSSALDGMWRAFPTWRDHVGRVMLMATNLPFPKRVPIGQGYHRVLLPVYRNPATRALRLGSNQDGARLKGTELMNTPIQGKAALVMKQGIRNLAAAGLAEWLVNIVHDEVVLLCPEREVSGVKTALEQALRRAVSAAELPASTLPCAPEAFLSVSPIDGDHWVKD